MQEYGFTERHMGTDVSLSFVVPTEQLTNLIAADVFSTIATYEARFSRFIPESELSQLNQLHDLQVSETFFAVLERAYELYRLTHGTYNPLVQIARHGYRSSFDTLSGTQTTATDSSPYNTDLDTVMRTSNGQHVVLDVGQQLDFGGMLKGYLADQLAAHVHANYPACVGAIINLGGDLATFGHDAHGQPFTFYVHNPITQEAHPITLTDSCLVTSGTYKRAWQTKNGTVNHILDATNDSNPVTPIISASVVHKDGAIAEAYAKVLLIHGITAAVDYPDLTYFTIDRDGHTSTNITTI